MRVFDVQEAQELNAEPWMLEALKAVVDCLAHGGK